MKALTARLWQDQDRHPGDRERLFSAIAEAFPAAEALYPGSFVDIAPSFVFDAVTYVDSDARAARFFSDADGVDELINEHRSADSEAAWRFIAADYSTELGLPVEHYDLLVSLYAGFISESCTRYLRPGGLLLVNPSHGDAAMASLDPGYRLAAVVESRSGRYKIRHDDLESYLQPKRAVAVTASELHRTGRGIAYTRSPFAYVFQRRNLEPVVA